MKKILFIAMSDSIHTARWISQLVDLPVELHLFPCVDCGIINNQLKNITVHHQFYGGSNGIDNVKLKGVPLFSDLVSRSATVVMNKLRPNNAASRLAHLIKRLKPDIIHSLEIQHSAYLTLEAKKRFSGRVFPPWIVTNWGSDIYLFGRLPEHESKIREVLENADFYSCECRRDVCLAEAFGFKGKVLPVFPNTGGFDLIQLSMLKAPGRVSDRRLIMLKGYQHWAGRALSGLRALERCADLLQDYSLLIYSMSSDVEFAVRLFEQSTGVPVTIIPHGTTHEEMLAFHGKARLSIGLSIGDGISTSFLEALVMGAFPIQSWTACADEWIEDGVNGLLVPPEDPDVIEIAIRKVLTDDGIVNYAAEQNRQLALDKLDKSVIRPKVEIFYESVISKEKSRRG